MKRIYENPKMIWAELCPEDILTASPTNNESKPKNELEADWKS